MCGGFDGPFGQITADAAGHFQKKLRGFGRGETVRFIGCDYHEAVELLSIIAGLLPLAVFMV